MKKILVIIMALMIGLSSTFACESIFDKIDGITCEIQYLACEDTNNDIKVCNKVLEKVEQYEEALEKYRDVSKSAAELKREIEVLKKEHNIENKSKLKDMRFKYLDLVYDVGRAFDEYNNAFENFLGEEGLKLMESEEFRNKLWECYDNYIDYNYLMD